MTGLPKNFVERMTRRLGDESDAFFAALEEKPPISIRINPDKGEGLFETEEQIPWCKYGRYLKVRPAFVFDPLYHAGAYYAQEASSMIFANAIDFSKDLKVLDLCGAPGGKSSLLLSMMTKNSILFSNELVGKRNSILYENLTKWGSANVVITKNRAEDFQGLEGYFDVVLVDAPCSGEGMFRKDPAVISQWSEGVVQQCSVMQKEILDSAVKLVSAGGLLIYSTCTFEERENEQNIEYLYNEFDRELEPSDFTPNPEWGMWEVEVPVADGVIHKGYYCFPHRVKGEGLFLTVFRKKGGKEGISPNNKSHKLMRPINKKEADIIAPYIHLEEGLGMFIRDGNVYVFPSDYEGVVAFAIHRLSVKKAGIHAGLIQRDNFIPEHELVMSGLYAKTLPSVELELPRALDFMQRMNVVAPEGTPKGWLIFTYKRVALGMAKNLGNRINNHYPTEWRIRKERKDEDLL